MQDQSAGTNAQGNFDKITSNDHLSSQKEKSEAVADHSRVVNPAESEIQPLSMHINTSGNQRGVMGEDEPKS